MPIVNKEVLTLKKFRDTVKDVARQNRFFVQFGFDSTVEALLPSGLTKRDLGYYVKSITLPKKGIETFEMKRLGSTMQLLGDKGHSPFSVTFINDHDYNVRSFFESWFSKFIFSEWGSGTPQRNPHYNKGYHVDGANGYFKPENTITLIPLGRDVPDAPLLRDNNIIWTHVFPINVDEITLDMSSTDSPQEFSVEFCYAYKDKRD